MSEDIRKPTRDTLFCADLGLNRKVKTLRSIDGVKRVDFRDHSDHAGFKGVSISRGSFHELVRLVPELERTVQLARAGEVVNYHRVLDDNVHLRVNNDYPRVDLRYFYDKQNGEALIPTRYGIQFTDNQWAELKKNTHDIIASLSDY